MYSKIISLSISDPVANILRFYRDMSLTERPQIRKQMNDKHNRRRSREESVDLEKTAKPEKFPELEETPETNQ